MQVTNINELPEVSSTDIIQKIRHICVSDNLKEIDRLVSKLSQLREYDYSVVKEYFNAGKDYDSIEDYENYLTDEWERSK